MKFLTVQRNAFLIFCTCGILDIISTMILIRNLGIDVEANPLIRMGFGRLGYFYFILHLSGVVTAAGLLSHSSWNDSVRLKVKAALFILYVTVLVLNWYQVAYIGIATAILAH